MKGSENLITWQSDFKRLVRLEGIWEHFLEDFIEFYSQPLQLIIDRFRLFTFLLETRSNARTNQDQYDRVAYQESYKAYVQCSHQLNELINQLNGKYRKQLNADKFFALAIQCKVLR